MTWLRRFFCRHSFEVVAKTHAPGMAHVKAQEMAHETLESLALGVTGFLLRCPKCGDVMTRTLLGKAVEP